MIRLLHGDCRDVLPTLPDASVHCVVTSPPYFGLRDYQTGTWEGGDAACGHKPSGVFRNNSTTLRQGADYAAMPYGAYRDTCGKCGARRIDRQIGLEATAEEYLATMVGVFREVRRVLRDDGCVFCNLGDSYSNKNLLEMPSRLVLALQADGWILRSRMPWLKRAAMPESCRDRPTSAVEYVFLLTKSPKYYWDAGGFRVGSTATVQHVRDRQTKQRFSSGKEAAGRPLSSMHTMPFGESTTLSSNTREEGSKKGLVSYSEWSGLSGKAEDPGTDSLFEAAQRLAEDAGADQGMGANPEGQGFNEALRHSVSADPEGRGDSQARHGETPTARIERCWDDNGSRVGCNQDSGEIPLPLLQAQDGAAGNGSCDPAQQRRETPGIECRPGVQELQFQEAQQNPEPSLGRNPRNSDLFYDSLEDAPEPAPAPSNKPPTWRRARLAWPNSKQDGAYTNNKRTTVRYAPSEPLGLICSDDGEPLALDVNPAAFSAAHFATFPAKLVEPLIRAGCPLGGTVLDPFAGAGTTLLVADRLQRDAIGIELSDAYGTMASARVVDDAPLLAWLEAAE